MRIQDLIARGTRAAQPAATAVSEASLYFVTDEGVIERSNGATWQSFSGAGGGDIRADGTVDFTAPQSMGGFALTDVDDPTDPQDAATKAYVDAAGGGGGGAGALVLLEARTAAASASLAFTTRNAAGQSGATFQADFDEYVIEFVNILPATNDTELQLNFSSNGGSSYDTTAIYDHSFSYVSTTSANSTGAGTGATNHSIGANISNLATGGLSGSLRLYGPGSTTAHKAAAGMINFLHTGVGRIFFTRGYLYKNAAAVNAMRFMMAAGNITSGAIRVYGVAK